MDQAFAARNGMLMRKQESYEIGSEQNPDQPNVWLPEHILPGYREFMNNFYWSLYSVSQTILKALALGIGLEESHLLNYHSGLNNQLRLLHYPAIPAKQVESGKVARMPAHSDWSSMTMLFQDDCGGLEVEDPNRKGEFVAATPIEGAIVMNVGDLLQHWSNGTSLPLSLSVSSPIPVFVIANSTVHPVYPFPIPFPPCLFLIGPSLPHRLPQINPPSCHPPTPC